MTDVQYQMICKSIQFGMPAMANELINVFNNVITALQDAQKELDELKKSKETKKEGK